MYISVIIIWGVPPRSRIWLHELEMFYLTNRIRYRYYSFGWALSKWTSLFLHTAAIACGLGGWCMRVTAGVMKCGAAMCQTNQSWEYTCPHRPSPATRWDRGQAALSSYDSLHPSSSHVHIIQILPITLLLLWWQHPTLWENIIILSKYHSDLDFISSKNISI